MELKPNMTVDEAIGYLRMLDDTIGNDIVPLLQTPGGAPFAVAREVFCYVDHLGSLLGGRSSNAGMSKMAKEFITTYMAQPQINPVYKKWGPALYEMYRHGPVHNFAPCVLKNKNNERLVWALDLSGGGGNHLQSVQRQSGVWELWVSTRRIVDDLREAIKLFQDDLRSNPTLIQNWKKCAQFLSKPKRFNGQ